MTFLLNCPLAYPAQFSLIVTFKKSCVAQNNSFSQFWTVFPSFGREKLGKTGLSQFIPFWTAKTGFRREKPNPGSCNGLVLASTKPLPEPVLIKIYISTQHHWFKYGLSPGRRHAIIWTNAEILLIGPLGTNFSEISIEIHSFSFTKMHLKMLSKMAVICLGLDVLNFCLYILVLYQYDWHYLCQYNWYIVKWTPRKTLQWSFNLNTCLNFKAWFG